MSYWRRIALLGAIVGGVWPGANAWCFNSLAEAYASALRSDRVYLAAEAQHRATLEKVPQARAGLLPSVSGSMNRSKYDAQVDYSAPQFQDTDRKFQVNGWTLSLSQPLFRMVNFIQYGRAQLQAEQSYVQLQVARNDLLLRTAKAFLDWQVALRASEAAETTRRHLEAVAAQAKSAHSVRLMTAPDLLDAEARFGKAEADALDASRNLQVKAAALTKVVGTVPPAKRFSFNDVPWPEVKGAVEQWVEQAKVQNGQVRYQTLQVAIADKDVNAARSGHLPTLNLVANKSGTFNSGSTDIIVGSTAYTQNQVSIGLQLEMPIFAGGGVDSRVDEAIALRDKAREDLENARGIAGLEALTHYHKTEIGTAQVAAGVRRMDAAQSQVAAARSGLAARTRLELDVIGAQAALLAAERDLFQAQVERLVSVLQLRQAAGELGDEDLTVWSRLLFLAAAPESARIAQGPAGMER